MESALLGADSSTATVKAGSVLNSIFNQSSKQLAGHVQRQVLQPTPGKISHVGARPKAPDRDCQWRRIDETLRLSLQVVAPSFTMMLAGVSVSIKQGGSMAIAVTTAPVNGFKLAIALSLTGLSAGVTATFTPTSIPAPGTGSSTLMLKVASGTSSSAGTNNGTVSGAGGRATQTQELTLAVTH